MRRHLTSRVLAGFALVRKVQFTRLVVRAAVGAYSLVGTAANVRLGTLLTIAAGQGTYALTGTAATLKTARKLVAGAGAYALTGTAAAFARGKRVIASAGTYALTGQTAALKVARKVAAAAGTYALTGTAATMRKTRLLVAAGGSYALTGTAATLRATRKLVAASGSYAFTGQTAALRVSRKVVATASAYALTGVNATLTLAAFALQRSYTFARASSMSMSRTPGSAGNRQKFTIHLRIKRVSTGTDQVILRADSTDTDQIMFLASDKLRIQVKDTIRRLTTATFNDTASWHDLVIAYDMSLGTDNSIRIYWDGTEITAFDTKNNPTAGTNGNFNNTGVHYFGFDGGGSYLDAKIADLHFIDGAQLTPSSFTSGSHPIQYAGSFGSGGLAAWITFANTTSTTTLGYDDAGGLQGVGTGSNDWTTANFNTANATTDVPS